MSPLLLGDVAAATGLSPDTIRGYADRGLLGRPVAHDEQTPYALSDIERIRLLLQLQAEGLGLPMIERLVRDSDYAADELLDLRRRVLDGLAGSGQVTTAEALIARFGDFGGVVLEKAFEGHLLVLREDGLIEVPSPQLLDIAERAVQAGISLPTAVDVAVAAREACLNASGAFLRAILDEVWLPFEQAGAPQDQVLDVARRMLHLRTLAQSVFEATLPGVLVQVFDRPFEEEFDMHRAIAASVDAG